MKVLVTGGAGFIGSHTCKSLAGAGHEIVVYDSLVTGHAEAVQWGVLEVGDIRDSHRLNEVIQAHRPDLVMHFAALAYVGEFVADPSAYYDVNVRGTLCLLDSTIANRLMKIIFSSTCATYGVPESLPIVETTPQIPINPYGFTKLVVERMLKDYEHAYGVKWAALRYFNAAGADPDGDLKEDHVPETHAIPLALRAALRTWLPFCVYGTAFPTSDGSAIRDYIHVSDLADAHVAAGEYLIAGNDSIALNLGTGVGTSVLELLDTVAEVTGAEVPVIFGDARPGDPPSLYADGRKAQEILGWTARFTSFREIVATAAKSFAN